MEPTDIERTATYIHHIDAAIEKFRLPEQVVVRMDVGMERILPFLQDEKGQPQRELTEGLLWENPSFISTSLDKNHLYKPSYGPDKETAVIFITLPKGTPGVLFEPVPQYKKEFEVLLARKPTIRFDKIIPWDQSRLKEKEKMPHLPKYVIMARLILDGEDTGA